jgi:hypothetical protein
VSFKRTLPRAALRFAVFPEELTNLSGLYLGLSEKKTTLNVPRAYLPLLEDIRLLQSDGQNPNRMTIKQHDELWKSLVEHGWVIPVVADLNGVLADGEQRVHVCKSQGEFFVPVLRKAFSDAARRKFRQQANKLKGKHNKDADAAEYLRLIEAGERESLEALLASVGERLPEEVLGVKEQRVTVPEMWEVVASCKDEAITKKVYAKLQLDAELKQWGVKLRIIAL